MKCPICGKKMNRTNEKWVKDRETSSAILFRATYECTLCERLYQWEIGKEMAEIETIGSFVPVSIVSPADLEDLTEELEQILNEDTDF